jgi:hypothetical protein
VKRLRNSSLSYGTGGDGFRKRFTHPTHLVCATRLHIRLGFRNGWTGRAQHNTAFVDADMGLRINCKGKFKPMDESRTEIS